MPPMMYLKAPKAPKDQPSEVGGQCLDTTPAAVSPERLGPQRVGHLCCKAHCDMGNAANNQSVTHTETARSQSFATLRRGNQKLLPLKEGVFREDSLKAGLIRRHELAPPTFKVPGCSMLQSLHSAQGLFASPKGSRTAFA